MIDWIYVLSQVLAVAEYGLLGLSYLAKNRKAVVLLDIASMSMGVLAFLLLGADLGMAMSVVILLANFYYLWENEFSLRVTSSASPVRGSSTSSTASLRASKFPRTSSKNSSSSKRLLSRRLEKVRVVVLAVVLGLIGVLAALTYDGPLSLLSVAATALYEISIWQKSTKVYKFLGIPVAGCWMVYNVTVGLISGAVCELWLLAVAIYGYGKEVSMGSRVSGKRGARKRKKV